jgi:hypothetical protein
MSENRYEQFCEEWFSIKHTGGEHYYVETGPIDCGIVRFRPRPRWRRFLDRLRRRS